MVLLSFCLSCVCKWSWRTYEMHSVFLVKSGVTESSDETSMAWRDPQTRAAAAGSEPAREEWEGHLQMEQRRGDNTCSFEEGGRPACQRRSSRGWVARHHSSPTESSSAAAAAASRDSRRERWLGWEEQAKSVQAAAKRAPPRALVSDVLAGAEGREALGWGSDERREEGDR
jgi:hypothetical protein